MSHKATIFDIADALGISTGTVHRDKVTLFEQFYFLKALAARLDAGRGTERDRAMFVAGLQQYDENYDRIRAKQLSHASS
jgi:hypothetical protein